MKTLIRSIYTFILAIKMLLGWVPFGKFALVLTSKLCVFLFDNLFFITGTIITAFKFKSGALAKYWEDNAIIEDIKLGVSGAPILNPLLRAKDNPPHLKIGHRMHTISDMLGRFKPNKHGCWWRDEFLEAIDKNHCKTAFKSGNKALLNRVEELQLTK